MIDLRSLIAVGAGAALGGVLRFLVATWFARLFGANFPWGTFAINVSGSFAIGVVLEIANSRVGMSPVVRLFLATGILGGYTTFSSFSYEALSLSSDGFSLGSLLYVVGSVVLGLSAAFAGIALVRAALA